ncbi:hypothetical protein RLEG12_00830 (plasmid) [Rhizobium leguminosarum bv. trifolii CB782]|nr:hypothetical protein RLEG12_00830 [Rhizobium leguminosarum bv. trifolii CB782]
MKPGLEMSPAVAARYGKIQRFLRQSNRSSTYFIWAQFLFIGIGNDLAGSNIRKDCSGERLAFMPLLHAATVLLAIGQDDLNPQK